MPVPWAGGAALRGLLAPAAETASKCARVCDGATIRSVGWLLGPPLLSLQQWSPLRPPS